MADGSGNITVMHHFFYNNGWPKYKENGLFDKKDMLVSDRAINLMKAREFGLLLPKQIKKIRLALGLSQRDAGHYIGGGPNAFQKYESGDVLLSKSADTALRLLAADPNRLEEIVHREAV